MITTIFLVTGCLVWAVVILFAAAVAAVYTYRKVDRRMGRILRRALLDGRNRLAYLIALAWKPRWPKRKRLRALWRYRRSIRAAAALREKLETA